LAGGAVGVLATCVTNASGQCAVTATSTLVATYSSAVSVGAGALNNSPAGYTFVSGAAAAGTSTVAVTGNNATANGAAQVTLTATVLDGALNAVSGETVTFVQPANVTLSATTCTTNASGQCAVTATSATAATYSSAVSIGAGALNNSPAGFTFVAGAASNASSTVAVTGDNAIADGTAQITLTVTIQDGASNAVSGEIVTFVQPAGVNLSNTACTTDASGQCAITATSNIAATYSSAVSIGAGALNNSPAGFTFLPRPADSSNSSVAVTGNNAVANGAAQVTLTATVRDSVPNAVSGETVTFVQPAGVNLSSTTCITNASGQCAVTATSTVAAAYTSAVSIGAGALSNSPANYNFIAGAADSANSTVSVSGAATADGVSPVTLTAMVRDSASNAVSGETVTFVQPAGVTLSSTTCSTNASGLCTVTATSVLVGGYSSAVSIVAGILSNSPASLVFTRDADGDGINDVDEPLGDSDGDGIDDIIDPTNDDPFGDADNDGIPDRVECSVNGTLYDRTTGAIANPLPACVLIDTDGDGMHQGYRR